MSSDFVLDTRDLPRRPGEMKRYSRKIQLQSPLGIDIIAIPAGNELDLDITLESVSEGILATVAFETDAQGECGRCLDPVSQSLDVRVQELYFYEKVLEAEDEMVFYLEGENLDLEIPIRDAVVLELPFSPLCSLECQGLCPECGQKWQELPSDHAHEVIDPRWSKLGNLSLEE